MYAYSHSGLGQVEDTGAIDYSGVLIIGVIALITLMLMGGRPNYKVEGLKKKPEKKQRGYGSTQTIYKKAPYKEGFFGDEEEEETKADRKKYARLMAKQHKLSATDEKWLEEHG
jgi:hypothetical protein